MFSPGLGLEGIHDYLALSVIADALETSEKQLRLLLYGRPEALRYTQFVIRKRRGGVRVIRAPKEDLKSVQQRLSIYLQNRYRPRTAAHGFVRNKSIVTNAHLHVGHRAVLNVDLKDFFPSINFGRVRGLFIAAPFKAGPKLATVLAQICCHQGSLPQGAPTSPVISNLICHKLDAQLLRLAKEHGCIYSRYADDLTFSKRKRSFPVELAVEDATGEFVPGTKLREIIEKNGFHIHPEKIHLHHRTSRQTVTGLIVNNGVNVKRSFVRDIRAIICDWRKRGIKAAEATHHEKFYHHANRRAKKPSLERIIEGKLNFLGMVKKIDDPVRRNLQRQFVNVWPKYEATMERENRKLLMRDLFISHASDDKPSFVRPLVKALIREGVSVWFDEYELTIGDDLVAKINAGMVNSRYGVVVLSPHFFDVKRTWPDREVGAMFALEDADKRPRMLPIWHNIDKPGVAAKNPLLAAIVAWKSADHSPKELAEKFRDFLKTRRA
jgi:RNA-directed DNA polymerase